MPSTGRNSMAEVMTVLVTVAMWIVGAMGVIGIPVLGIGLMASLSGGTTEFPGIKALADGVMPGQLVIGLAGLIVIVPGVIFICLQLRRILLTLAEGDPFVPENASRLSSIGIVIAVMELIRILTVMVVRLVPTLVGNEPPRLSTQFILWISVAALFVLSQVFREGTRLRDEEKMTI
ncbi:DUF2975 domain-containing protein [Hyphomonas sp.]|uniref:DUF2975 domain-containing protein n=1 Tax=Hyphomonas sp. TaxID=87 RepID=UPI0025C52F2E|nr:DUF2975 domain-containing protein [Hyphomonas sp.]